jgi:hypothetical protein
VPVVSKRQNRFFHAHEGDKGKLGKVAREFIAATPKGGVKKLPETVKNGKPRAERWYGPKD